MLAFLHTEPTPEDRIEQAIARLTAQHYNRTRGENDSGKAVADFLPFATVWSDASPDASALDYQFAATFSRIGKD